MTPEAMLLEIRACDSRAALIALRERISAWLEQAAAGDREAVANALLARWRELGDVVGWP